MATLTNEQIDQKKQQLEEKAKEIKALYDELVEAGAITSNSPLAAEGTRELSEGELDGVAGGGLFDTLTTLAVLKDQIENPIP